MMEFTLSHSLWWKETKWCYFLLYTVYIHIPFLASLCFFAGFWFLNDIWMGFSFDSCACKFKSHINSRKSEWNFNQIRVFFLCHLPLKTCWIPFHPNSLDVIVYAAYIILLVESICLGNQFYFCHFNHHFCFIFETYTGIKWISREVFGAQLF